MLFLKKYCTSTHNYQGINILKFRLWRFEFHWFTDCGEWFVYLRWYTPTYNYTSVKSIRFSSAGFMKHNYIIEKVDNNKEIV